MKELLKLYYLIKITRHLRKDLSHLDDFIGSAKLYDIVSCSLPQLKATAGGRRWKRWPGVSSKLQNSNLDRSHLWGFRSLGTCLVKVFCLFESVSFFFLCVSDLFEIHLALTWLGSLLQLSNAGARIVEGKCLKLIWIKDVCVCECTCSSFSPKEKSHGMGEGKRYCSEMRGSGINMPRYILTNAFNVPVRTESSLWDRGQLSAADLRGVYERINLCRLSIC